MAIIDSVALEFLTSVSDAALANPFGEKRDQLDKALLRRIAKNRRDGLSDAELISIEANRILQTVVPNQGTQNTSLPPQVRQVIHDACLFSLFHKFMNDFDEHIIRQNRTVGQNLPLTFAGKIAADLKAFDLPYSADTVIALFFQMRRAFFFISQNVGGQSPAVTALRARLWQSIFSHDLRFYFSTLHSRMESFSTLLIGETGVGKSQAAAALGRSAFIPFDLKSGLFAANFLDVHISANISEYPESLIESELFGHKKGSFTGALDNYSGLLGQTHVNGVLFLDEIGELSLPVQVKLLRVLQDRVYFPVGSHQQCRFSGRLITATNAELMKKIEQGLFRADLYYRMTSDVIELPSLRDRLRSSPDELRTLIARICSRLLGPVDENILNHLEERVTMRVPKDYPWPGNLRELEQCVRTLILHGEDADIDSRLGLSLKISSSGSDNHASHDFEKTLLDGWHQLQWSADDLLARYVQHAYQQLGSFERVAQNLKLDWRTVKKWVGSSEKS